MKSVITSESGLIGLMSRVIRVFNGCTFYFVMNCLILSHKTVHFITQWELPGPIPQNSVESDHGCTSNITLITRVIT